MPIWTHGGGKETKECVQLGRLPAPDCESCSMLVLSRKAKQSIMIGDDVEITVLSIDAGKVRIGIQAPREVSVHRTEIYLEIREEGERRPPAVGEPAEGSGGSRAQAPED